MVVYCEYDGRQPSNHGTGQRDGRTLVQRARQTTYYTHLVEFLSKRLGEKIPKNHTQAFEREDGHQVIAITDSTDQASLPRVGITFVFDGEDVTHAVAEVNYNAEIK